MQKPVNRWNYDYISPGSVGSVGDANVSVRYKQSAPDLPMRWAPGTTGPVSGRLGSYVQDGYNGGKSADTFYSPLPNNDLYTPDEWVHQDFRAPEKSQISVMGELPQYSWKSQTANTYNALNPRCIFGKMPGGYGPTPRQRLRGGNFPRTTDLEISEEVPGDRQIENNALKMKRRLGF